MEPIIYLASSSPRRYDLLTLLNIPFEQIIPAVPEVRAVNESPENYILRLAQSKAQAGFRLTNCRLPVLGADTVVLLEEKILEKPKDKSDAKSMLRSLSGRWHKVMTAIAVVNSTQAISQYSVTDVQFCHLSEDDINDYIDSGEPMDKAGAYGIQGFGGRFVKAINGSYHNVVGLPLVETKELIDRILMSEVATPQ